MWCSIWGHAHIVVYAQGLLSISWNTLKHWPGIVFRVKCGNIVSDQFHCKAPDIYNIASTALPYSIYHAEVLHKPSVLHHIWTWWCHDCSLNSGCCCRVAMIGPAGVGVQYSTQMASYLMIETLIDCVSPLCATCWLKQLKGQATLWLLQHWMMKTLLYWIAAFNITCSQISLI